MPVCFRIGLSSVRLTSIPSHEPIGPAYSKGRETSANAEQRRRSKLIVIAVAIWITGTGTGRHRKSRRSDKCRSHQ
jgi:hypothetical protein